MSALSRNVHCFWFCLATQKQRLLKESIKIDAKTREIHQHVTWEHRAPRAVPLSEVSVPFRASDQAFSKKCCFFRVLCCFVIELAGLIRWCLRYHAMFIVFCSVRRHKISDYSKKALKLMRKYEKHTNMWRGNIGLPGPYRSRRCQFPFAQVFKPSERSAGFFVFCVVLWLSKRVWSGDVCAITRCSLFLVLFDDTKSAITQRKHKNWCENTPTCDVGTSYSRSRRCQFPFAQVFKPSERSAGFSEFCVVL